MNNPMIYGLWPMKCCVPCAVLLAGCGVELTTVDLSDRADVIAFVALLDDDLAIVRTTAVFGVEDGALSFGARPQLVLAGDESIAVVVEIDRAELARDPAFEGARASEIAVVIAAPPERPELAWEDPRAPFVRQALPESFRTTGANEEVRRAILGAVTLSVPVDPEWCRPTAARFVPYGASPIVSSEEVYEVVQVGDQIVILTDNFLHVLERGGTIDGGADTLDLKAVFGPRALGKGGGLAVRGNEVSAVVRVAEMRSGLLDLEVGPGSLTLVRTATTIVARGGEVAVSPDGRRAFTTKEGFVVVEKEPGRFVRYDLDGLGSNLSVQQIVWTDDPLHPIATTTTNKFQLFDTALDRFIVGDLPLHQLSQAQINGLAKAPDGIWGGGSEGFVFRFDGLDLEEIVLQHPPRALLCSPTQTFESIEQHLYDVAFAGGYLYLIQGSCNAVIAVRLEDRCASLLPTDTEDPALIQTSFASLSASEDRVIVVGSGGRVFVVDL